MKSLEEFLYESLDENCKNCGSEEESCEKCGSEEEAQESIKNEKDFREYAEKKFKEVFGDELDEERMKNTIDGILKDNKDKVEKGEWGEIVGILNKSFGSK